MTVRWAARRIATIPRRPAWSLAAVLLLVAGTAVVAASSGYSIGRPRLLSGAAWLASSAVGQLTLLDGASAEVAAQVQVAPRGSRLAVVQRDADAYALNRSSGQLRRVDGATFELSPPVNPIPDASAGLHALAGPDTLYVLDTNRGVLTNTDPVTLANSGPLLPLAAEVTQQAAVLDPDGRLWILDSATGDLVWLDRSQRHTRRAAAKPTTTLTLAGGAPVLVDRHAHTATLLDPTTGEPATTTSLDLRPDDRIQVSGAPHADRLYLVTSRGLLAICQLQAQTCDTAVPLGGSVDLGTPVETGGRVFVPDYGTGRVWIVDLNRARVIAQPEVVAPNTRFQLLTRDGLVFFNNPDSQHAGIIRLDGGVRNVFKYDPADPDRGLTQPNRNPATAPPSVPNPPDPRDQAAPDVARYRVQIVLSAQRARVGDAVVVKAIAPSGTQPSTIRWSFGDGTTATGVLAEHRWSTAGRYQVSVRASFADGQTAIASRAVEVVGAPRLTVQVAAGGSVTGGGIACPPTCTVIAEAGRTVTLTARPDAGRLFLGWRGGCLGAAPTCAVTVSSDVTVIADFTGSAPSPGPSQLSAPTQLSPANGSRLTHFPRTTTLRWGTVAGATRYHVEVECLHCAVSGQWGLWRSATITATTYTFDWEADNQGRWRVTAVDAAGNRGRPSAFWTFSYDTGSTPLPAPVLRSPANGSVFGHYPRTTTVSWAAVAGAGSYRLEIDCSCGVAGQWVVWRSTTTTSPSYTFDWVGAQSGRWRVTAISPSGAAGTASGFWQFRYTR